jgi:U3 small nucleolar RNA-associated protein 25
LQPKEAHGCDFSRVRSWYLDNNSKHFRQTIALSPFNTPELNTLFFNQSKNWAGKIRLSPHCPGVLESENPAHRFKQTFSRFEPASFSTDPDERFAYLTTAIIPSLLRHSASSTGTLIFIPSSFDFPRVRNYFATNPAMSNMSFGTISEENTIQQDARARSHFMTGRHKVLLYTERAHHFRRYKLRGVKKVIMYGLPDNPRFYRELVNGYLGRSRSESMLEDGAGVGRVIFSKWDALKLERIVGTDRVGKMMTDRGDTFEFL